MGSEKTEPDLPSMDTLDGDEKLPGVDDPGGTPVDAQTTPAAITTYVEDALDPPLTVDTVNNRVGINQPSPVNVLDVVAAAGGNVVITGPSIGLRLHESDGLEYSAQHLLSSDRYRLRLLDSGLSQIFQMAMTATGVGVNEQSPAVALDIAGDAQIQSNGELRFADNGNYVGFEAPALAADQIWVLPDKDAPNVGDIWGSDAAGNLGWYPGTNLIETGFSSPSGGSGTFYERGHYRYAASDNDFSPAVNFGTANVAYGDHILFVAAAGGGGGTDTVIRVAGTSITDSQVRTAGDTEDVTLDDAGAAGAYYETSKKWNGTVSITKISGPDLLCNYGGSKYFDYGNRNYTIKGLDCSWRGGANDASADIRVRHHKSTGWTYNAGSSPTPPTAVASQVTTNAPESETRNGEEHAWKITDLDVFIEGSASEGFIIELFTTSNKAFDTGSNISIEILPAVSV